MENVILIVLLVAAVAAALVPTLRHFRGQGGCCGGSDYKIKRKKLKTVLYTHTFAVSGMHCERCQGRVEEIINDVDGLAGRVDRRHGTLTISYGRDVPTEQIAPRLQKAGYTLGQQLD